MAQPVDKIEYRAVIGFLLLKGNSAAAIYAELVKVYGSNTPSYDTVVRWHRRFRSGQTSLNDEERSGRPSLTDKPGITSEVEALVVEDRRITIEAIAEKVRISHGSVFNMLHDVLNMKKIAACWVPRQLTPIQKACRVEAAAEMLRLCRADPVDFFSLLISVDECWVYHYDPMTEELNKEWKRGEILPAKRAKMQQLSGKVLLRVFWDCHGVLLTDYACRGQTVTGTYY
ncbi:histone-lysine N-methyltransferase SETMAR-like [Schistocerca nitens]|uniref:histone-lysine N-methyltransferase SETMAR-like n=1 Tax=Schistocerca nitens TaxID=7011 RepID=UPI002117901D|nr:histone-lysine N-methyltransferase SETMAR-like [Schistocerca nitens]XP_049815556.1 histone-lysine N-methyltransferase SETMAR-like [Schistocerca nitens]XP_049815557.1 histone-lysine N-methyltransferase SETMAR-like [Schistocerca nitens]XP_049815558.1 histone-lysine N-methyltransferase SETMAR-like [Schistocerca nitens]